MRGLLILGAVLVGFTTSCAHFECVEHGGVPVRTVASEHFAITSALPETELRKQAEQLELLWDTFVTFFGADVERSRIPVVLLQSTEQVGHFARGYAGYVSRTGPRALVVGAPDEDGNPGTNAHELTHLVSAFLLPRQPRWVAEGLATLFEDAVFKSATTVKMGRWNKHRAQDAFQLGLLTLEELAAWGELRFNDSETQYYGSAWAWIHYLVNHDEARLQRLFAGLRGPAPVEQVLAEVFPPQEAATLHGQVKAYLAEAKFRGWETSLQRSPRLEAPVTLAPWEVHALRAELYLANPAAQEREQRQAVALAPRPLPARAAVLAQALEKKPAAELLPQHRLAPEVLVAADEEGAALVRADVEEAVQAHPQDASLRLVAARSALRERDVPAARAHAAAGVALAPWSSQLVDLSLQAALAQKDCPAAQRWHAQLVSLAPERPTPRFLEYLAKATSKAKACR